MRTLLLQRNHSVKSNIPFLLPQIRIWNYIMALLITTSICRRINMFQKPFRYITIKYGKNYPHFPVQKMRFNKLKYFDWSHLANDDIEMFPGKSMSQSLYPSHYHLLPLSIIASYRIFFWWPFKNVV